MRDRTAPIDWCPAYVKDFGVDVPAGCQPGSDHSEKKSGLVRVEISFEDSGLLPIFYDSGHQIVVRLPSPANQLPDPGADVLSIQTDNYDQAVPPGHAQNQF